MDDLELLQRCFKQDKAAWDEFVDKYSRLIYKYIHAVLKLNVSAHVEPETVSDLYQEIFLSLVEDNFRKLKTFKGKNGATLASWLRQVTINRTISYLRSLKPSVSIDEDNKEGLSLRDILADSLPLADDKLADSERFTHLADCIGRLDNQEKYFLKLHVNQGIELEKLKEHFGLTRPATDMRKSRIVQKLRDCFKMKGLIAK